MKKIASFILTLGLILGFTNVLLGQNCLFDYVPRKFSKEKLNIILPTFEEHLEELKLAYQNQNCDHDTLPIEWYPKRRHWERKRAKEIKRLKKDLGNPVIFTKTEFEKLKSYASLSNNIAVHFTFLITPYADCIDGGWRLTYSYQFIDLISKSEYKIISSEDYDQQVAICIWKRHKDIFQVITENGS